MKIPSQCGNIDAGNDDVCAIDFWTIASRPRATTENNEIFTAAEAAAAAARRIRNRRDRTQGHLDILSAI